MDITSHWKKKLEIILNLEEVWYYYRSPKYLNDGLKRDVNDGTLVHKDPLHIDVPKKS